MKRSYWFYQPRFTVVQKINWIAKITDNPSRMRKLLRLYFNAEGVMKAGKDSCQINQLLVYIYETEMMAEKILLSGIFGRKIELIPSWRVAGKLVLIEKYLLERHQDNQDE